MNRIRNAPVVSGLLGACLGAAVALTVPPGVLRAQGGLATGGAYSNSNGSRTLFNPAAGTTDPLVVPTKDALSALASGAVAAGPARVSTANVAANGTMYSGPLGMTDVRPGVLTVVNLGSTTVQLSGPEAANASTWILALEPGQSRAITLSDGGVSWAGLGDGSQVELAWVLRHP